MRTNSDLFRIHLWFYFGMAALLVLSVFQYIEFLFIEEESTTHLMMALVQSSIPLLLGGLAWWKLRPALKNIYAQIKLMQVMQNVASAANATESVQAGFEAALGNICDYTGWKVGHAYLYDKERDELVGLNAWYVHADTDARAFRQASEGMLFKPREGFIGEVFADSTPMWILDVRSSSIYRRKQEASGCGLKAAFGFPVLIGGKAAAVLEFYSADSQIPDEELLKTMASVCNQLAQVIERARFTNELQESLRKA